MVSTTQPFGGQAVQFVLQPRDMSIWSTESYAWQLQRGEFTVSIGASSRDIRLTGTFTLYIAKR